jgi:hypothetical protein
LFSFNFSRSTATKSVNKGLGITCAALLTVLSPMSAFADAIQVGIHPDLERKQKSGPPRIEKMTDKVYVARAYDAA